MALAKESAKTDEDQPDAGRNGLEPAASASSADGRRPSLFSRLRREKEPWLEINDYLAHEVRSDEPVLINADATLLGNVIAPKVQVSGTVSGSVYAREVDVLKGGQIWGDVFATSLQIAPGGLVQGWVSSIDEADWQRMQQSGTLIDEENLAQQVEALNENLDANFLTRNDSEMESLHLLQTELAVTLAARYEMEQDFERRLTEMAGEAYSKIHSLTEQLTAVRSELAGQKKQLDEFQETIHQQKSQIERQTNELSVARELMTDQNHELKELRDLHNGLRQKHEALETEKATLNQALKTTLKESELLQERVSNLETAHKANLQYQADQEDSLLRWQELAEITEKKASELETHLQKVQYQMDESSQTIKLLREQRQELENELEKALNGLRNLQQNHTRPIIDTGTLTEATDRIAQLEAELADTEQEYLEQIIWYKASLGNSRSELEQSRETLKQHTTKIEQLETDLTQAQEAARAQQKQIAALQAELATLRSEAAQFQTILAEKETTWQNQSAELQQTIMRLKADQKNMQTTLRETNLQLDAAETEVNQYLAETKMQGERLAEIHATLVERELQLKQLAGQLQQARTMVTKQNEMIKQIKEAATKKIQALQAEIGRLKSAG